MRLRFLFLALLIALLPLRGWVGDVMAMERTTTALAQGSGHHLMVSAADIHADTHADCPGHAGTPAPAASAADDCGTCTACQLCHAPALTPAGATSVHLPHIGPRPGAPTIDFASAERAPGFKPPIS